MNCNSAPVSKAASKAAEWGDNWASIEAVWLAVLMVDGSVVSMVVRRVDVWVVGMAVTLAVA